MDDPDILILHPRAARGTYRSEKFRIYAESSVEGNILDKWPDLDARNGDAVEIIVRRIRLASEPVK